MFMPLAVAMPFCLSGRRQTERQTDRETERGTEPKIQQSTSNYTYGCAFPDFSVLLLLEHCIIRDKLNANPKQFVASRKFE